MEKILDFKFAWQSFMTKIFYIPLTYNATHILLKSDGSVKHNISYNLGYT